MLHSTSCSLDCWGGKGAKALSPSNVVLGQLGRYACYTMPATRRPSIIAWVVGLRRRFCVLTWLASFREESERVPCLVTLALNVLVVRNQYNFLSVQLLIARASAATGGCLALADDNQAPCGNRADKRLCRALFLWSALTRAPLSCAKMAPVHS